MGMRGPVCSVMRTMPAPNPDPGRWLKLRCLQFANAYVLVVKYLDCTNFEGIKVMVYRGHESGKVASRLDPHFTEEDGGPIARFRPSEEGIRMAVELARSM